MNNLLHLLIPLAALGLAVLFLRRSNKLSAKGARKGNCGCKRKTGQAAPVWKPFVVQYCPWCSTKLVEGEFESKKKLKCTNCTFVHWDNPIPVVVVLIPHTGGIVLVKRNVQPRLGFWALPAGFVDSFESPFDAAKREAKEETGLDVKISRCIGAFATPGRNQFLMFFLAEPVAGAIPGPILPDVSEARPFKQEEIPAEVAFPSHKDMIDAFFTGRI